MFFIGRTRYSLFVPNSESWRLSQGEDEQAIKDYRAELYDTARLKLRQEIFLNHTLPNLKIAAEGFDVTHVVSFSASLPEEFKDALRNAAEEYPFLILDEQADGKVGRLQKRERSRAKFSAYIGLMTTMFLPPTTFHA